MVAYMSDEPYAGTEKILIGFDIGTTQSMFTNFTLFPMGR
jgi:hypothetical protein